MTDNEWYANATLFADLDDDTNPFVVDPTEDLTGDSTPLRATESYLTNAIVTYIDRITGGQRGDLQPMTSLAVEETYAQLGYPHSPAYSDPFRAEGPSHAELRDLPDPTPADFRETLTRICDEPEAFVRSRQVATRTGRDALALLRMLPQPDHWNSNTTTTTTTSNSNDHPD